MDPRSSICSIRSRSPASTAAFCFRHRNDFRVWQGEARSWRICARSRADGAVSFFPDGSLTDDASVALRRIRRDIEKQKGSINDSLQRFMRAHRQDGTLQEDFVTIREDRYVVPIVAGQKGRVDGVIHGSSGTGRTLYVEPLETIDLNNQLVRLREDELREIDRILLEITDALREHSDEIASTAEALAQLDFVFAKATFASQYNAIIPRFSKDTRRLVLREARHPLLETVLRKARKPIVPISFELTEDQRCLLISGPNTGGKTVTMKTAGLLALMVHAGLPVPCSEAEFPLLDNVLADIGDSQSIEESLSSFSGHLIHVKQMLEAGDAGEPGAARRTRTRDRPGRRRRARRCDAGRVSQVRRVLPGFYPLAAAEALRHENPWCGERLHGVQRSNARAHVSVADRCSGQVGWT